jgi:hypothetical protein
MDHRLCGTRAAGSPDVRGGARAVLTGRAVAPLLPGRAAAPLLAGALLLCTTHASGQSGTLRAQCAAASRPQVREFCEAVADATVILQPRVGIALSGGNPVPGTASTLGMRLGALPRASLGLRVTAAAIELPPVDRVGQQSHLRFPVGSISADGSLGIYQGMALLPTVGGFGSVDVLGSVGVMPLPRGEGFDNGAVPTWALGARLGVLRESFTAPGVSIDFMYRSLGDVSYGSPDLRDRDAFLKLSGYHVTSVRGTAGKRVFGFGATAGVAYDRYRAGVTGRVVDAGLLQPDRVLELSDSRVLSNRTSWFANASLTLLILNLAAEAGWQRGGAAPPGATNLIGKGAPFGGIAVRLAI